MDKQAVMDRIKELGVLAVIRGPSPELTLKIVGALAEGGVTGIEITYTTPDAEEVVAALDAEYGDRILLGMGTLTRPEQAAAAKAAGARFLVSPHTDDVLAAAMVGSGLPIMMGALTPSEVFRAYALGSDIVKLFPGSAVGPSYVKALQGPYPYIPLMPTGGVSESNVADWFAAGVFAVGAGSQLSPAQLAREGRFNEISTIAQRFATAVTVARAAHMI